MKPEHISNLVAAISAIIAVIAIIVSVSQSKETDRIDLEKRISVLESAIEKKADNSVLSAQVAKLESVSEKVNEAKQQIVAKADIKEVATREDLVRLDSALDKKISGKTDLSSVSAIIEPLQKRVSQAESAAVNISNSLASAKAALESNLSSKTSGITHSNPSATGIDGNLVASKNKWDGEAKTIRVHTSVESCPDGWYVVGIGGIDTDGGNYCTSCISDIQFVCREL